jgi:hypothetical protein
MNWQHCADTGFVGLNDSFEQIYQAERRFWRFGQKKPVTVHFISAETEGAVVANLRRKEADAARMASETGSIVGQSVRAEVLGASREWNEYNPQKTQILPSWIGKEANS